MTYQISKDFEFSASHVLDGLAEGHQCGRLHGHNYIVRIVLESEDVDATGFVVDFGDLAFFKNLIDRRLDHRHLNDVLEGNPTSEHLAMTLHAWAYASFGNLIKEVAVSETPKTWARYSR